MTSRPAEAAEFISLFGPVPPHVRQALVTVDGRTDHALLPTDGRRQLAHIVCAANEERMCLQARRNCATGRVGLVVCESWNRLDASQCSVLAELLGAPGGSWEDQTRYMDRLTILAREEALALVSHGIGEHVVVFVTTTIEQREDTLHFEYLARLFSTEGELAQWRER